MAATKTTRRTALAMLGLPAAAAMTTEAMAKSAHLTGGYQFGADRDRTSQALRRLADDIDAGGTHITEMTLTSTLSVRDFLAHELTLTFHMRQPDEAGPSRQSI